ncbi:MAG: ATP-binding protein [Sulfurovum sp.]|jgi:PAS domain S-box-containing protein
MKIKLSSVFILALLTVIASYLSFDYFYEKEKSCILIEHKQLAKENFEDVNKNLTTKLNEYKTILTSISNKKNFTEFIKYYNKSIIPNSITDEKLIDSFVNELFLTVGLNNKDIFQLRYLDKEGNEVVRVDKKDDKVFLIDNLQDKSNRYYFEDSKDVKKGTFWLSKVDLNVEQGQIEVPYKPTLRVSTPVYIQNFFEGFLIVNINMNNILQLMISNRTFKKVLLDKENNILISNDKYLNIWSNYLNTDKFKIQNNEILLYEDNLSLNNNEGLKLKIIFNDIKIAKILNEYRISLLLDILFVDILIFIVLFVLFKNTYLSQAIQRALEKREELHEKINSFAIMSRTDLDGKIVYVTDRFCTLSGYSKEELIGKTHSIVNDPSIDDSVHKELWETIKKRKVFKKDLPIITKSGEKRYLYINIYPELDQNNNLIGYLAYRKDNTAEILLKEHNEILKKKIDSKTKKLKDTISKLSNLNEELACSGEELRAQQEELIEKQEKIMELSTIKEQFLSNMSHEIRTPLNGIVGITDIILNDNECPDTLKEKLNIIKSSSRVLTNVVNDILDFTALKNGKIKIFENKFSLKNLINNVDSLMRPEIESKGLDFSVELDEKINDVLIGDEFRLNQVIMNFLSNAMKFTNDGNIKLRVVSVRNEEKYNKIKFVVTDTGIGMTEDIKKNIFKAFTQSDKSNTSKFRGTGLGLTICKELIELMGGNIWFESNLDRGTMMFFTVKLNHSDVKFLDIDNSDKRIYLENKKTALLVEDDNINQVVAKTLLNKIGFTVILANNGLEALELCKTRDFDIIFMDIQMSVMNGYDATINIKKFNALTPIVAISAGALPEDIYKSHEVGMEMHITKPIVIKNINKVIKKYFNTKKEIKETNKSRTIKFQDDSSQENSEVKILNYNLLLNTLNDEDIVLELLKLFVKKYENHEDDINSIIKNKDELREYIYRLKGISGNLKLNSIYDLCSLYLTNENNIDEIVEKIKENIFKAIIEIKQLS